MNRMITLYLLIKKNVSSEVNGPLVSYFLCHLRRTASLSIASLKSRNIIFVMYNGYGCYGC